jgi:hypothetical protein
MKTKEVIEKLTPAHFERGEGFDAATFASLKANLQKSRSDSWKMLLFWFSGILLAAVFAGMGGATGNLLAVASIFAGMIAGNLSVMGTSNALRKTKASLGITNRDIRAAIKQVKDEVKNAPQEHV